MSLDIKVPSVGESISEGILAHWLKKDGDYVQSGEPLYELETDKATQDVPAPAAGVLKTAVKEGTTVAIGSVVGQIDTRARPPEAKPAPEKTPRKEEKPVETPEPQPEPPALSPRPASWPPTPAWMRPRSPAPAAAAASPRRMCKPSSTSKRPRRKLRIEDRRSRIARKKQAIPGRAARAGSG